MTQATMENINPTPDPTWFTSERKNWLAMVIFSAAVGYGAGNGHTTQSAIADVSDSQGRTQAQLTHVEKVIVPTLQKKAATATAQRDLVVRTVIANGAADSLPTSITNVPAKPHS